MEKDGIVPANDAPLALPLLAPAVRTRRPHRLELMAMEREMAVAAPNRDATRMQTSFEVCSSNTASDLPYSAPFAYAIPAKNSYDQENANTRNTAFLSGAEEGNLAESAKNVKFDFATLVSVALADSEAFNHTESKPSRKTSTIPKTPSIQQKKRQNKAKLTGAELQTMTSWTPRHRKPTNKSLQPKEAYYYPVEGATGLAQGENVRRSLRLSNLPAPTIPDINSTEPSESSPINTKKPQHNPNIMDSDQEELSDAFSDDSLPSMDTKTTIAEEEVPKTPTLTIMRNGLRVKAIPMHQETKINTLSPPSTRTEQQVQSPPAPSPVPNPANDYMEPEADLLKRVQEHRLAMKEPILMGDAPSEEDPSDVIYIDPAQYLGNRLNLALLTSIQRSWHDFASLAAISLSISMGRRDSAPSTSISARTIRNGLYTYLTVRFEGPRDLILALFSLPVIVFPHEHPYPFTPTFVPQERDATAVEMNIDVNVPAPQQVKGYMSLIITFPAAPHRIRFEPSFCDAPALSLNKQNGLTRMDLSVRLLTYEATLDNLGKRLDNEISVKARIFRYPSHSAAASTSAKTLFNIDVPKTPVKAPLPRNEGKHLQNTVAASAGTLSPSAFNLPPSTPAPSPSPKKRTHAEVNPAPPPLSKKLPLEVEIIVIEDEDEAPPPAKRISPLSSPNTTLAPS